MTIQNLSQQAPFTTKDGSTIRSILDLSNAPVERQSLAEASLPPGGETDRHYHKLSEEFYFVTKGEGEIEIEGEIRPLVVGDAVLIPSSEWHQIKSDRGMVFLCCCSPPYSHEDTYFE